MERILRDILTPIRSDGKADNVLAHAAALGRRYNSHVSAVHCRPRPEDMLPYGVPIPRFLKEQIAKSATSLADSDEAELRSEFDRIIAKYGLSFSETPDYTRPTASWREVMGKQADIMRSYARLANMVVVAQPDHELNLGSNTLKAALFHSGRPVMMCPPREAPPETLGARVAIAWNGSLEASRAVNLCRILIRCADSITILTTGRETPGATADDLVAYLGRRGISAGIDRFETRGRNVGQALLDHAGEAGADTLIMGAYGDSHERETIFGGNTQTIVDHAKMPVVFVH